MQLTSYDPHLCPRYLFFFSPLPPLPVRSPVESGEDSGGIRRGCASFFSPLLHPSHLYPPSPPCFSAPARVLRACSVQVLVAEDPTNLCTNSDAKAVQGRQALIKVLIPLPDNIMSYVRVSPPP